MFVGLTNVITYAKNGFKISSGFSRATGGKAHVSLLKACTTLPCATALACDDHILDVNRCEFKVSTKTDGDIAGLRAWVFVGSALIITRFTCICPDTVQSAQPI